MRPKGVFGVSILLLVVIAVTVGAVVFGVMTLISGGDPGLTPVDPDSRARPLPGDRPLAEQDVSHVTFDLAWRGYRMDQVDRTLQRLAYDIGYKTELIGVLEAEISALREGRFDDADTLAEARVASLGSKTPAPIRDLAPGEIEVTFSTELSTEVPPVEAAEDELDPGASELPEEGKKKSGVA
jgi:DivIVA domain-containing protein